MNTLKKIGFAMVAAGATAQSALAFDFGTDKVSIIKPDTIYMVLMSVTENNPNGDRFAMSKEQFEKEYKKIV